MNAAMEFDVGPLTWVKSEIDLALERADQALQQYTAGASNGAGDLTQIKFSRTHLHQVQGALTIVGLDGVTQFAEALECLLEAIEQQKRPADAACIDLAQRALASIRHYLDDLISGQPNQTLRLLPLYREVQSARGQERVSATDLFFPDLSTRPPQRDSAVQTMDRNEFQRLLRQERARFQRGLLSWLRAPQDRSGISEMLNAVKRIEATQDVAAARSFWWVATGFLAALAEGTLPAETDVKQLCARIDLQIRRLFEGSRNVAERLMRDALYFVASAESNSSAVQQVKSAYALQAAIAACHARALKVAQTDWTRIAALYDALAQTSPSPVITLNRAVAVAMAFGPSAGLEIVDTLLTEPSLQNYHLLPSVRGDLLARLDRLSEAGTEFERAANLTRNAKERALLIARALQCTAAARGVPSGNADSSAGGLATHS